MRSLDRCSWNCCRIDDPDLEGFDISAYIFPTEEVSGDYYDWVKVFDDQIGIIVADAVGKGIPAALLMSFPSGVACVPAFRSATHRISLLSKVSNLLWDSIEDNQFITAIYGILDSTNRTFVFSNAGHNPPLLIKPDGEYRFVEYGDMPLGMFLRHALSPAFYSVRGRTGDGHLHRRHHRGGKFERRRVWQERFAKSVLDGIDLPAKKLIDHIRKGVADFTERKFLDDDGTLFIVKAL